MRLGQSVNRKREWKATGLAAFLVPFVGMLIVMAACGYRPFGNKAAMLYSDCYHQYYPFFVAFRRALLSGDSLLYSWNVGMGVDYLGMIAYYLGSPLNLLSVLVPEGQLLNYFSLLVPLKLGFAGLFFSLFLKGVFRRDDLSVAVFGGFYALCAWALGYQWNLMWLDTFALLPLVMLGMLSLLRERKFVLYTISLWLSVFSNYYIGLFTCFFVFLTFFCYEICQFQGWKRFFCDLLLMGVFSVLAIGMSTTLTLTSLAALQTTQSSVNTFPTTFRLNIAASHDWKGLLDGMRQVAGNMGGSLEPTFKEGLPNLYCGVGSVFLGMLFLMSEDVKLRDKLCSFGLILFFNLSFLIRQLDYIWHGFHFPNMIPYRFSFLHSFVLLYMAYRAWLLRRKFDVLQIFAAMFLAAGAFCCSNSLFSTQHVTLWGVTADVPVYIIYNAGFLVLYTAILVTGSWKPKLKEDTEEEQLRVRRIVRYRRRNSRTVFLILAVLELAATLTAFACYFPGTNVTGYPKGTEEAASMLRYMHEREEETPFFRAEVTHSQTLNDGALNGYNGISAFTSSANVHITEFMRALGYGAKNTYNRYCFEESSPVANLFLDLKYMLDRDGKDKSSTFFDEVHYFGKARLYRNTAYLPLGFLAEPELATVNFLTDSGSFQFQNQLFRSATNIQWDVWHVLDSALVDVYGTGVEVTDVRSGGFCTYSDPVAGANLFYSYVADRDGFACVHLNLPKRNDFYISVNGTELYRETISLPQMLAVQDVHAGDVIDIRILCKEGESGTATVNLAILDNDLFAVGYAKLASSVLELTHFSNTRVEGFINCDRDGLLYTSIPQNGNWYAYVDGKPASIVLVGDCMVALTLREGQHTVQFVYRNEAFRLALGITSVCMILFGLLILIGYRPGKQETAAVLPEEKPEQLPEEPENLHPAQQELPEGEPESETEPEDREPESVTEPEDNEPENETEPEDNEPEKEEPKNEAESETET